MHTKPNLSIILIVKFECAGIILLFCRRKYAVNFELQLRRKSVRDVVQIDYGIPLEDPCNLKVTLSPIMEVESYPH